jgi:predicted nucleotidyltransferase
MEITSQPLPRPDSDLDIAVMAHQALADLKKISLISALAAATGRPIDLIGLEVAPEPLLGQDCADEWIF